MKKIISTLIILLVSMNITVIANEVYMVDDGHESYYSPIQLMAMGDYGGNLTGATWYWPIHGYSSTSSAYSKITSSYGFRGGSYNRYHKGVDIGESLGTAVYSIRSGTVSVVDNSTGGSEGRSIIINHNDGYWSVYMHLSSINVTQGQSVTPNTKIGAVGGSGYNSETYYPKHLHLGIHYGNSFDWECNVNPCPSGYTRIGNSLQASAGGYPIGSASIAYSVSNYEEPETHTHLYSRGIEATHPHREYMKCNCGDYYYTGNNGYYIAYEDAHPHRYYYDCEIENCSYNYTYTGENGYEIGNEAIHPHRQYYVCPVESCSYNYTYTGKNATLDNCEQCFTPGKPEINNMKKQYYVNDLIQFFWDATENTTHYNMYLDKLSESGEYVRYITKHYAENGIVYALPIGKYKITLQSTNSNAWVNDTWAYTDGDWYYFEVIESTSFTESIVTKKDSLYSVETTLHNFTVPYDILIVGYKGKQFVTMKRVSHNKQNSPYTLEGDIDKIKIMVWSDLSTLIPLCEAEIIPSSEFIKE